VRGQRDEVALELVEPDHLVVTDRLLEEGGGERSDGFEQREVVLRNRESPAGAVGAESAEASPGIHQRQGENGANAELFDDLDRRVRVRARVLDEDDLPALDRAVGEQPGAEVSREPPQLLEVQTVRGHRLDVVAVLQIAKDRGSLEPEGLRDAHADPLENGAEVMRALKGPREVVDGADGRPVR
jgi:hypothetical protein